MRLAALALILFAGAVGAAADDGRITYWDGETLREAADPMAAPKARADQRAVGVIVAPGVAMFIEPAVGASAQVSNLLAGALARRFSGHVDTARVLGAGRVFTIRPFVTSTVGAVDIDWRLRDEQGAPLGGVAASVQLGAPGSFTADDAERMAFQIAARLSDPDDLGAAFAAAAAMARIDRVPTPAARPGAEGEEAAENAPLTITAAPPEAVERSPASAPASPAPRARPGG